MLTENPVLEYFNISGNKNKSLSTKTLAKRLKLRQKDIFYYILSNDNFKKAVPLDLGYSGSNTRVFRLKNT